MWLLNTQCHKPCCYRFKKPLRLVYGVPTGQKPRGLHSNLLAMEITIFRRYMIIYWLVVWNMNLIFHVLGIIIPID